MLDPATIRLLKLRAGVQQRNATIDGRTPFPSPSTFVALSAHAWISIARAKGFAEDDRPTVLVFLADCRAHLDPPVDESFVGNCVQLGLAWATGSELAGIDGLARACMAIQRAVREALQEPLKRCKDGFDLYNSLPRGRTVHVVGSPRFAVYDIEFGWGKPTRVELVSMNHDGEVVLVGGKEEGSVQVSVALSVNQMEMFVQVFQGGLLEE